MDLLKETYRIWAMHREFRTVLAELNTYTDRELTELGLDRADIVRTAYAEAERRVTTPQAVDDAPRQWHGTVSAALR